MSSPIAARTERTASPRRRLIHRLFEASLLFKGLFAGFETLAGLTLLVTPGAAILGLLDRVTAPELAQDPRDLLARTLLDASQKLSIETQHFYALYLLTHGGVKLVMVLLLARGMHWAYPVAMGVLALFIAYQIHLFVLAPSATLVALSLFDVAMIWLVHAEWRGARARIAQPSTQG
ncbi:putative membrane protein [Limimaricola variabilis]|uniref:Membrane protein n=1 Tax=Limimaricola variabilis TaxID=1492771 RepID=A0ABR6HPU0_9RHOB|nr:DUF2127 domain-containing protein [Limimaricola variabilis]MBB3712582.1 putative membrane protein [Limimaricola variabilis]